MNKQVNVIANFNNLNTKVHDFVVGKLKTVPVDFKKLSDVVDHKVIKNSEFNTLKDRSK